MYANNQPILTSQQYYQKYAPSANDLFNAAKLRCQQLNPTWHYLQHNQFAFSVLWLMGKIDASKASPILVTNYQRLNHMRNAARNSNPMCCTPALTPIGQWGFESALEFTIAHFESRIL